MTDEQMRKLVQKEEIQMPNQIEVKWNETLQALPQKRKRFKPGGFYLAAAAMLLFSVSVGTLFNLSEPAVPRGTQGENEVQQARSAGKGFGYEEEAPQPYHLSALKQNFSYTVYGFQEAVQNRFQMMPVSYQIQNRNGEAETLEIIYQMGTNTDGLRLYQTVMSTEQGKSIPAAVHEAVNEDGIPMYQPIQVNGQTFYLFAPDPPAVQFSAAEGILAGQRIQIQIPSGTLTKEEWISLLQGFQAQ